MTMMMMMMMMMMSESESEAKFNVKYYSALIQKKGQKGGRKEGVGELESD